MTDDSSRIVPVYRSLYGRSEFVGTAFFVDGRHLLTARHVVEPYGPARQFRPLDPAARFGVLLPTDGSIGEERRWVEVQVVGHAPDEQDAILLRFPADWVGAGEPFRWLKGMDEAGWTDRSPGVKFRVRGFPRLMPELPEPATEWVGKVPKPQRNLRGIAEPTFDDDSGLVRCEMLGAESLPGTSGAPVFWTTTGGDYCLGMATEGGARTRVLGAGALLPWLAGHGVNAPTVDLADIRDERLVPHLERVQALACSLLVPVLGLPQEGQVVGDAFAIAPSLIRFLDLFIHLHARNLRSGEPPRIRREVVQAIYEREVYEWRFNQQDLPPFAEAELGLTGESRAQDLGRRALRVAHRVGQVLAGEGDSMPADQEPWEVTDVGQYPVWFRERVESGKVELLETTTIWSGLTAGRQVVIVGGAGCGKTTAALFLSLALTTPPAERRHPKLVDLATSDREFCLRLPVLVRLRDHQERTFTSVGEVEAMLQAGFAQDPTGWEVVCRQIDRGRALLIFDGLDELDAGDSRRAFAKRLGEWRLKHERAGNLVLVTSRPTAYPPVDGEQTSEWEFKGFGLWELQPLTPRQQRLFLEVWFGASDAEARASRLFAEIQGKALQELSQDPLMLVGLARLAEEAAGADGNPRSLPSARPAVLDALIDLMMTRWERARAGGKAFSRIEVCLRALGLAPAELRQILADLSLESMAPRQRVGDFDRSKLEDRLRDLLKTRPESATQEQAFRSLMEELGRASGLVRPKEHRAAGINRTEADVPVMEFPVRPFRNHLAGEALFRGPGDAALDLAIRCVEAGLAEAMGWPEVGQANRIHSEEVVHLGLCHLAQRVGLRGFLESFRQRAVRHCSGHSVFPLIRAAVRVARELDGWRCEQEGGMVWLGLGETALAENWVDLVQKALLSGQESRRDRAAMATLLGLLQPRLAADERCTLDWCPVPAPGPSGCVLGDELPWGGGHIVCDRIASGYYMARAPVTVRQFEIHRKAEAAGSPAVPYERLHPDWRVPVFHVSTHPVVGVDYEMATAFCVWLTDELRAGRVRVPEEVDNDLEGWEVRLPDEWEWEYAARGGSEPAVLQPTDRAELRRVPWGWADDFGIRERVNCDLQWHWTLPVDFETAASASPFGVEGVLGNVWEWCRTPWVDAGAGKYPGDYWAKVMELDSPGVHRVVRGGSWLSRPVGCRCASRSADRPDLRGDDLGFRPVLAPVPGWSGRRSRSK